MGVVDLHDRFTSPPHVHRRLARALPVDNFGEVQLFFGKVLRMSKMYESAEDVMARIDAQAAHAIEAMDRAQEYRRATELLRCRGTRDGVAVEVNGQGFLIGIDVADSARSTAPRALVRALMSAYDAALDQVVERLVLETREAWGDDETTAAMVDDLRSRFGQRGSCELGARR